MKKILTYFFCTLGVIFFIILCGLAYLWFADPFEIRPMLDSFTMAASDEDVSTGEVTDKNPALSAEQEQKLESLGIDPAKLPSEITPEMEACFLAELGAARVAEIKAGATPTASEVFATRTCYQ